MKICGLDPSQSTGWSLYDTERHHSSITAGTLNATGNSIEEKASVLGDKFQVFFRKNLPDLIAIEMPPRRQFGGGKKMKFMGEETIEEGGTGIGSIISTNMMVGALMGVIGAYRRPFVILPELTWRKAAYGFARKPGWERKDWKKHAREQCELEGIEVTNDDAAEAVWIAMAAKTTDVFRYLQAKREAA